ncbi:hypothetical protein L596_022099 [Steinernema carpocapsae]|uniref:Uncharacterized protein n=1 Tax=Steinernema carpocapsae TaxID=34508 RepID=A0A4U5MKR7_STECR|nr:hypothetical protein L596_022099 [Steinernema carpocapsae]
MQRVYQGAGDPPRMTTHLDASGLGPKIFLTIERPCGHGVRRHLHDWTRRSLTRGERTFEKNSDDEESSEDDYQKTYDEGEYQGEEKGELKVDVKKGDEMWTIFVGVYGHNHLSLMSCGLKCMFCSRFTCRKNGISSSGVMREVFDRFSMDPSP